MEMEQSPVKGDDPDDLSDLEPSDSTTGLTPGFQRLSTHTPARNRGNGTKMMQSEPQTPSAQVAISEQELHERLRQLTKDALKQRLPVNAAFYADKLVTLSRGGGEEVLLLAQAYHQGRDFRRAVQVLERHGLLAVSPNRPRALQHVTPVALEAAFLAAQCLASCDKHEECVQQLEQFMSLDDDEDFQGLRESIEQQAERFQGSNVVSTVAAMCCLRGKMYEAQDNRSRAVTWLKNALKLDVYCVEALEFLADRKLLSHAEEKQLLGELRFGEGDHWLRSLYSTRLCVTDPLQSLQSKFEPLEETYGLGDNPSLLTAKAEAAYVQHDPQTAYELAKKVYAADPLNESCVPIYVCAMVELGYKTELYYCAHQLVEAHPKSAVAWYAVGCYYTLVKKSESAQRYFHKATKLDPRFAPAWIGFGNAFAAQDESDQAMAAYRTASRLMPSSHLPLLYIGMEYLRTNNLTLAHNFLAVASDLCNVDPLLHNEMGVVLFRLEKHEEAAKRFRQALKLCKTFTPHLMEKWEDTIVNLGHCYRKCQDFPEAIKYYHMAIALCPRRASSYAALAFTHHLQGLLDLAIEYYHRALGLKPDDTFAAEMLTRALEDVINRQGESEVMDLVPSFAARARLKDDSRLMDEDEEEGSEAHGNSIASMEA